MSHVIEPARSGRASCRGCGQPIANGELRFGERVDNPYGEGDRTLWFHLQCGAYKRPEPFLEALARLRLRPAGAIQSSNPRLGGSTPEDLTQEVKSPESGRLETTEECVDNGEALRSQAEEGVAHRRLPRIDGAQRSPTGRARCRSCRELIAKGEWRISLVYWEMARFEPSGFVHAHCAKPYFDTADVAARIAHFAPELRDEELDEIRSQAARAEG